MNDRLNPLQQLADLFQSLGQPARLRIFLAIGTGEACVYHLEHCLGLRQAYVSQQLMHLREAGLVETRRQGKHIYYSLKDPRWIDLVAEAAALAGLSWADLLPAVCPQGGECDCPHCTADLSKEEPHPNSEIVSA